MNQTAASPLLFEEKELSGIQTTGNPWIVDAVDPATVPVPLQVVITHVQGPYTARDRKLWTFLLHAAFDELGKQGGHEISIRDINSVFRACGGEHSTEWIWQSAKRLSQTIVEFEVTYGDERFDGITSIFAAVVPRKGRRGSTLHFWFPEPLIPIIKQPLRFARLRVHFMLKLSGKYAVTLYEILEGYTNRRDGVCRVTIEELRQWLKVPEGSYQSWKDFRKWVLDPAIKQINDDPLGAGFSVEYEPIRKGRFYHEIIFRLKKTGNRQMIDNRARRKSNDKDRRQTLNDLRRPYLSEEAIEAAARETKHYLDMKQVEREFWEFWESKDKPTFDAPISQVFLGFAKRKYGQVKYGKP